MSNWDTQVYDLTPAMRDRAEGYIARHGVRDKVILDYDEDSGSAWMATVDGDGRILRSSCKTMTFDEFAAIRAHVATLNSYLERGHGQKIH